VRVPWQARRRASVAKKQQRTLVFAFDSLLIGSCQTSSNPPVSWGQT
jgi:hypothetical protein